MTNLEQAKLNRDAGLATFLTNNTAEYATDTAMSALATKYATDYGILQGTVPPTTADNSGFNQEKLDNKDIASEEAATLCASAQVQLDLLGMVSISEGLHDSISYYAHTSDAEAVGRLQGAHDLMNTNIATLSPDYVTTPDLDNLQKLINNFTQAQGTSESVHATSPALTTKFKSASKVADKDIVNILKRNKKYKTTNPDFFNALEKQCKIPAVNIHHTILHVTVLDKITGTPISLATITVSNSTKTATTDTAGFAEIDILPAGNPTLTIIAPGYLPYTSLIHITRGLIQLIQ